MRRRLDQCADDYLKECGLGVQPGAGAGRVSSLSRQVALPWALSFVLFVVAVAGWWPRLIDPETVAVANIASQWRAQLGRERMLETVPQVGHWPWSGDGADGRGDVVWDNERQRGFLLLHGLAANDPQVGRYQLWIFDAERDDRYPVDGGIFDIPPGRDFVVIPVKPAVRVSRPAAFAVTAEQPGGAVVSSREQVVAFARTDR